MAEVARSREGVRGVHSTGEGVQPNTLEGRGPALIELGGGGKREGMPETDKDPAVDKVRELQRQLWACAKQSKTRRFHALYDRIYRSAVLWEAWKRTVRYAAQATPPRSSVSCVRENRTHSLKGGYMETGQR